LKEKETLLKEVPHRVKNNLQVISSLLGLHADQLGHASAEEAFLECRHRVKAMALVPEQLYGTQGFDRLDLTQYFHDLVKNLVAAYRSQGEPLAFTV